MVWVRLLVLWKLVIVVLPRIKRVVRWNIIVNVIIRIDEDFIAGLAVLEDFGICSGCHFATARIALRR